MTSEVLYSASLNHRFYSGQHLFLKLSLFFDFSSKYSTTLLFVFKMEKISLPIILDMHSMEGHRNTVSDSFCYSLRYTVVKYRVMDNLLSRRRVIKPLNCIVPTLEKLFTHLLGIRIMYSRSVIIISRLHHVGFLLMESYLYLHQGITQ